MPLDSSFDLRPHIRPHDTLAWGQFGAQPLRLTRALMAQRHALGPLRVFLGIGQADHPAPEHADTLHLVSYAGGGSNRALAKAQALDVWPCHYSGLPQALTQGPLKVDVLMLQVSPPDEQGRYSLGQAHEYLVPMLRSARTVLAEVHPDVPWTHGEATLAAGDFALLVESDEPLADAPPGKPGEIENAIGRHIAGLVEDGATLQIGIGTIPDAALAALSGHRDLGVHSGAIGDGIAALAQAGVVTNARKAIDTGNIVAGVLAGGERMRRWAHRNEHLRMRSTEYTHHAGVLARIERFTAINSAIEVDLTGQVNAEVAAGTYVGAVGGALDFSRAALASPGGRAIIALPSTARGSSRIVASLAGPASAPRSDCHFVVTEHGVADLRGLTVHERIRRMIAIADPAHREALEQQAHALHGPGRAWPAHAPTRQ